MSSASHCETRFSEEAANQPVARATFSERTSAPSLFRRLRLFQIRALATLLNAVGTRSAGRDFIKRLRAIRSTRTLLDGALGFRRSFPSFSAAQACAALYIQAGHEHPDDIRFHTSIAGTLRESDYPILFHLGPLAPEIRSVFDFGGNVGNLFYSYEREMHFPATLAWVVYDLPIKKVLGAKLAAERGESRIRFSSSIAEASGSDVFIASGSLHYFEEPLHEILATLPQLPKHVFVNRTPCSPGPDLITVQDNKSYLVPCKLHSRSGLIKGMEAMGYELRSEWPVYERRLIVPTHPDLSARTYSGFYFVRK
jgi:putative methyltransferase (TIGR04325 family)